MNVKLSKGCCKDIHKTILIFIITCYIYTYKIYKKENNKSFVIKSFIFQFYEINIKYEIYYINLKGTYRLYFF